MYRMVLASLGLLVSISGFAARAAEIADWPYYRHDRRLTARSPARGNITEAPVIKWKYYLGGWHNRFAITQATGQSSPSIPTITFSKSKTWDGVPLVDVSGDGKPVPPPSGKVARLLPGIMGLQSVQWTHLPGQPSRAVGRCYSYEEGIDRPKLRWQTEEESEVYELLWTLGDVDGDGLLDVVFVTHYRAIIYDGQTGKKKSTINWPIGRNYGQITLADVDGDALPEIVVVADSPAHVDVLKYRPEKGELLWSHRYVTDAQVSLPIELKIYLVPHHVLDLDGDGRPEIVYNRYHFENDHRWHVVIRDSLTGTEKYNLSNLFLWGIADMGGTTPVLCCLEAHGRGVPDIGTARLMEFQKSQWTTTWRAENVRWQTAPYIWPIIESSIASLGPVAQRGLQSLDVDGDGKSEVLVVQDERTVLAIGKNDQGKIASKWEVTCSPGGRCQVEGVSAERREALINVDIDNGELLTKNSKAECLERCLRNDFAPLPARPLPLIADVDGDGKNEILIQDTAWRTRVLRCKGDSPRQILSLSGGGLWLGRRWEAFPYSKFPVFSADLDGDGKRELVLTDVGLEGQSSLTCWSSAGKRLWERSFPETPARSVVWIMDGNFISRDRIDLFVVVQDGSFGDCYCLNGRSGEILWRMEELQLRDGTPFRFGSHGPFISAADLDGDGLGDLCGQSGQYLSVIRGKDGKPIVPPRNMINDLFPRWVNYGIGIVGDWENRGDPLLFTNTASGGFGLVDSRLQLKWDVAQPPSEATLVGSVGRISNERWAFGTFSGDRFRTFDITNGIEHSSVKLEGDVPHSTAQVICGDIDNDGHDEFLTTGHQSLLCVSAESRSLRWSLSLPTTPSDLLLADADNDGWLDILFSGTDGCLYCVGKGHRPSGEDQ